MSEREPAQGDLGAGDTIFDLGRERDGQGFELEKAERVVILLREYHVKQGWSILPCPMACLELHPAQGIT